MADTWFNALQKVLAAEKKVTLAPVVQFVLGELCIGLTMYWLNNVA